MARLNAVWLNDPNLAVGRSSPRSSQERAPGLDSDLLTRSPASSLRKGAVSSSPPADCSFGTSAWMADWYELTTKNTMHVATIARKRKL
mmetsp:Transcript_28815/g.45418  ORF Transcript_28815/g.45418 Transcript_28815/m.45418 type:complete len:89 (-) Transcript_28815:88-354(-)